MVDYVGITELVGGSSGKGEGHRQTKGRTTNCGVEEKTNEIEGLLN